MKTSKNFTVSIEIVYDWPLLERGKKFNIIRSTMINWFVNVDQRFLFPCHSNCIPQKDKINAVNSSRNQQKSSSEECESLSINVTVER